MRTRALLLVSAVALLSLGCGDGNAGGEDSGPGSGDGGIDAQVRADGGPGGDGGGGDVDASTGDDGGTTDTDSGTTDTDSGTTDVDSGTTDVDAGCATPVCPPPPTGCNYVGGTACSCGTLECTTPTCGRCMRGQYCATPDGMCGGTGTCSPTPDACIDLYSPVCGCDGMTYSNSCYAHAAGQSVAYDGECPPPADCRTTGCGPRETCQPCRGPGGGVYICLPEGTVC